MLVGTFTHNLDDKGRLTLPAKFREELAPGVVVTYGLDDCLVAYPQAAFATIAARLSDLPMAERPAQRHMFGNAADDIPDKQGRVLIPLHMREYAGLDGEAVIIGLFNRLEIWNPDRWAAVSAQTDREALAEKLRPYGI